MRIIGGKHKGRAIKTPRDLPVRPTTDFAKEALFNILNNRLDFEDLRVLDLFSGTGNISLEFASRGASAVEAVDKNFRCAAFLKSEANTLSLPVHTIKEDVFRFLSHCSAQYDLIFADPPYDLPGIEKIPQLVFEKSLLKEGGMLIVEHGPGTKLHEEPQFAEHRKYGNVNFSFFKA